MTKCLALNLSIQDHNWIIQTIPYDNIFGNVSLVHLPNHYHNYLCQSLHLPCLLHQSLLKALK